MKLDNFKHTISKFPHRTGIYLFKNKAGKVIYIGKALSLRDRLTTYLDKKNDSKTSAIIAEAETVEYQETISEFYAILTEAQLIKKYQPKYNITLKDDKSFLYVFISLGEEFPKIWVIRRPKLKNGDLVVYKKLQGIYFGPFPSANILRELLKKIRRIFPFCQQSNNLRPCFYSQLKLCHPCPGYIVKQDTATQKVLKRQYRQNIFHIIKLFEGKNEQLQKELIKELNSASKALDFEHASYVKHQLQFLENLTTFSTVDESMWEIDDVKEILQKEIISLQKNLQSVMPQLKSIHQIEAFDISNFQGDFAVGSQIVFINGLPQKNLYKRYKIKTFSGISDVAMLKEILIRRLKHSEWKYPDLILIDGGIPQLSCGLSVQKELHTNIPMLGLAKRFEKVIIKQASKFQEIKLDPHALNLLKRIRDEAHRFALSYHRQRFSLLTKKLLQY